MTVCNRKWFSCKKKKSKKDPEIARTMEILLVSQFRPTSYVRCLLILTQTHQHQQQICSLSLLKNFFFILSNFFEQGQLKDRNCCPVVDCSFVSAGARTLTNLDAILVPRRSCLPLNIQVTPSSTPSAW